MNEVEILKAAQDGNLGAFKKLMDKYLPYIHSLALKFSGDEMEADDITQEVFIRTYKNLKKFRFDSKFSTWLYRITINQAIKSGKKRKREAPMEDTRLFDNVVDPEKSQIDQMILDDQYVRFRKSIEKLPEKQRAIMLLRIDQELSFKEISVIMKRTIGAVKANYFHAVNSLKNVLAKEVIL